MATRLMREIRFTLTPDGQDSGDGRATDGLSPYLTLRAVVRGPVDPITGYICNIQAIDRVLRERAIGHLRRAERGATGLPAEVAALWHIVATHCPDGTTLDALTLHTSPYLSLTVRAGDPDMVSLTCVFEFCAAHRLYCESMTDEENRRVFGRCTNPNGHGHNYVVNVTLQGKPNPETGTLVAMPEFERIVNERVIDVFDHKHLNEDLPEFASINPSVENIARVIHGKLVDAFSPARLQSIRVYETPKTYAEYAAVE